MAGIIHLSDEDKEQPPVKKELPALGGFVSYCDKLSGLPIPALVLAVWEGESYGRVCGVNLAYVQQNHERTLQAKNRINIAYRDLAPGDVKFECSLVNRVDQPARRHCWKRFISYHSYGHVGDPVEYCTPGNRVFPALVINVHESTVLDVPGTEPYPKIVDLVYVNPNGVDQYGCRLVVMIGVKRASPFSESQWCWRPVY